MTAMCEAHSIPESQRVGERGVGIPQGESETLGYVRPRETAVRDPREYPREQPYTYTQTERESSTLSHRRGVGPEPGRPQEGVRTVDRLIRLLFSLREASPRPLAVLGGRGVGWRDRNPESRSAYTRIYPRVAFGPHPEIRGGTGCVVSDPLGKPPEGSVVGSGGPRLGNRVPWASNAGIYTPIEMGRACRDRHAQPPTGYDSGRQAIRHTETNDRHHRIV